MAHADAVALAKYRNWKVFGTGTWSSPVVPSALTQSKTLLGFFYQVAKLARVPFPRLVWAARHELGEVGGREHYHWLIGADNWTPTPSDMFRLNSIWNGMRKAGFSRNHIFNPELNGIGYFVKGVSSSASVGSVGGDFYESGKFGADASEVTFSDSFLRVVGGRRVCVEKYSRC